MRECPTPLIVAGSTRNELLLLTEYFVRFAGRRSETTRSASRAKQSLSWYQSDTDDIEDMAVPSGLNQKFNQAVRMSVTTRAGRPSVICCSRPLN